MDAGHALIVCVGNSLVGDDAVGCAVYDRLVDRQLPPGVRLELLGVGGIRLLDLLEGEDTLVAVDSVHFGAPPGTIHVLAWDDLPRAPTAVTSHGIGLREAIEVGRKITPESMPSRVHLVGIEGREFDRIGNGMTAAVAAAVERAASTVLDLVGQCPSTT